MKKFLLNKIINLKNLKKFFINVYKTCLSKKIGSRNYSVTYSIFNFFLLFNGFLILLLLFAIFLSLIKQSIPALKFNGFYFFTKSIWDPVKEKFGVLTFVTGTISTSIIALLIAFPFAFCVSILLGEYLKKDGLSGILKTLIDLMAGVPSVVYGFWGLYFIVPFIRKIELIIGKHPYGVSIASASIVLAIMIIPYLVSISTESISMVPIYLKEAAYSLGATKLETILKISIPYSSSGFIAGIVLSYGRAIGETMAVTMLIGNSTKIPLSIFDTGNTMASVIANEFTEATKNIHLSSLIEIALLLFVISLIFNLLGKKIANSFKI